MHPVKMGCYQYLFLLGCASLWLTSDGQQSSEGTIFAIAVPPDENNLITGNCHLMITAKETANIEIHDISGLLSQTTIDGGTSYYYAMPCSYRTQVGLQNQGIRVTSSDNPVSVLVFTEDINQNSAGFTSLDLSASSGPVTYRMPSLNRHCPGTYDAMIIAAGFNATVIDIYEPTASGDVHYTSVNIHEFNTYTMPGGLTHHSLAGFRVDSNLPISVVMGAPCVRECTGNGPCNGGQAWSSVLEATDLGMEHVAFPVVDLDLPEPDRAGMTSELFVTANVGDTDVFVSGGFPNHTLAHPGDTRQYALTPSWTVQSLTCSENCVLNMLNHEHHGSGINSGMFFTALVPTDRFSNDIAFSTPSILDEKVYLSVVVNAPSVGQGQLLLNGADISGAEQNPAPLGMTTLLVPIDPATFYTLASTAAADLTFAAYVYGFGNGMGFAYLAAFQVVTDFQQETTTMEQTTITPIEPPPLPTPPPEGFEVPALRIGLHGEFMSGDGSEFTTVCRDTYGSTFNQRSIIMVGVINDNMAMLCPNVTQPGTEVRSVTTIFFTSGDGGQTFAEFILTSVSIDEFETTWTCANSIGSYLEDHANWGMPVIPQQPECPAVVFDPLQFNHTSNSWFCGLLSSSSALTEDTIESVEQIVIPLKSIHLESVLEVVDGEPIIGFCHLEYSRQLESMAISQFNDVNARLSDGRLCYHFPGMQLADNWHYEFIAELPVGMSMVHYELLGSATDSYNNVELCTDEVNSYLEPFENGWAIPLMFPEPGCPFPEHRENRFDGKIDWICP